MAAKKAKKCTCVDQVNAQIKSSGVKLMQHIQINFITGESSMSGPLLQVSKIDKSKRTKLPTVMCSYCPFCGIKLE